MEMTTRGAEGEGLLRPEQRSAVVMPHSSRPAGWGDPGSPEKAPFLRNEPVKLTPAWEGSNLPNDTLNLKGITMDLVPPKDKWHLIYLTLLFHGLGTLTAWNMFITAKNYFVEYKLEGSPLAKDYMPYVTLASQFPNFVFSWFNVFARLGGNLTTRIVWSLSMEVVIFVVTVTLAMLDSSTWPTAFFWITMVSVVFLNMFNSIFQNSVFGVAARLPPRYTGAVVTGSNVCGILIALLNWATDSASSSVRTAAIYYFIGGMFVLLICFDTYFALPLNRFFRYHDTLEARTARPGAGARPPYLQISRRAAVQLWNIFITFFVTLAVFPTVHSDIQPLPGHYLGELLGKNFTRFTCFITFNATALLGSITASFVSFPRPRWLITFTTLRIAFIPLFLLCNYVPKGAVRTLPVYVGDAWLYWALAALMGWSSGHGSSLGMQYVSTTVPAEHAPTAGMIGGAMLITGIVSGIAFSNVCPQIVSSPLWS